MNGFKNLFRSKAIIATIVGAVFALLAAFNVVNLDPQLQDGIVAAIFALAGFFRFTATEQLTTGPSTT